MTSRERLLRIFRGEPPDRPAVKLWGIKPDQKLLHPAYEPVHRAGMELTDLMPRAEAPFNIALGKAAEKITETFILPGKSDEWEDVVTRVHTPEGTLESVYIRSTEGKPGYQREHLLKEPEDIDKLLSVPYEPYDFSPDEFWSMEGKVGDRGVTMFGVDHAMYGLQRLIGSENFALWSIDCRDKLLEAIEEFSRRIRVHIDAALDAGVGPVFGWYGPELCIPPLMSVRDFDDFVDRFDRPLIERIHERGGYVWVHCHGRMGPVLERFADMGVDVLNPIEPPPMGDITLEEAFRRVGDRMGLEGNIEEHDIITASEGELRDLIREAIRVGSGGRRFILCPTSSCMEWPDPDPKVIRNLLIYIEEGVRCAEEHKIEI